MIIYIFKTWIVNLSGIKSMELEIRVSPSKNVYNDGLLSLLAGWLANWEGINTPSSLSWLLMSCKAPIVQPEASGQILHGCDPY